MQKIRSAGYRLNQFILITSLFVCAALLLFRAPSAADKDTLYQVSAISALMKGDYYGHADLKSLRERGDIGIGTFDHIDGELIELDSRFYRVKSDGHVNIMDDSARTPFAMVTFFSPDKTVTVSAPLDLAGLVEYIDLQIPTKNIVYAIKITGRFGYVKARSVPRQDEPYPELSAVIKEQSLFEMRDIDGTIVAFRIPEYAKGINATGYHMHFLSSDKKSGGHLLECRMLSGRIEIDYTDQIDVSLPKDAAFFGLDLSQSGPAPAVKAASE